MLLLLLLLFAEAARCRRSLSIASSLGLKRILRPSFHPSSTAAARSCRRHSDRIASIALAAGATRPDASVLRRWAELTIGAYVAPASSVVRSK